MAIRFARQAGNWSDPLTWDDGLTIPTTGDEVYLNGYNVTIDQDITTGFIANSITPIGVPLDPIPDMTSNISPVGVGQAFATQNNLIAWQAFRKGINNFSVAADINLGWRSGVGNIGQLGFQFDSAKIIKRYSFYSSNQSSGQRPRDWTFEGSNDGITWTILHTVAGYSNTPIYASPVINNTTSYTYYRINVTATISSQQVHLHSFTMTESTSLGNGYLTGGTATIATSRTVNADLYNGFGTNLIVISAASPNVVNITGNMPGTKAVGYSTVISVTGNCTLNYVGNVAGAFGIGGQLPLARGIVLSAAATVNVTGDVYGGSNSHTNFNGSEDIGIQSSTGAIINVVGNVSGGTGAGNRGIQGSNNDTINITGNITGGAGTSSTVILRGILLTGTSNVPCSIVGNIIGSVDSFAIQSTSTYPVKITGNIENHSSGRMAISAIFLFLESNNMSWQFRKYDLTTNTLYTPGVATGHPAESNVRTGITYGPTNNLTGTCAVPPAAAVSLGVPVDNTVGTAYLNATDIWNVPLASITTPNSIGERLKDASTVQSTGAQLAAFL